MSARLVRCARRTMSAVIATAVVSAAALAPAGPAAAAGGPVTSLAITPSSATTSSGTCVTFTVTEKSSDGTNATSGQFTPTVTLGGNTLATYGTPTAGPVVGLPPACTDSKVTATDASGSVFTFGVVTTDPLNISQTTTITVGNAAGTIPPAVATESIGTPSTTTPTDADLSFGAPTTTVAGESCPTTTTDPMTATGATQQVCALVTADSGLGPQGVSGQTVTFTVDRGTVADSAADATAPTAATTYMVASDSSGVATAFVSSIGPGAQNITAVAGTGTATVTSNGLVDTYQGPNVKAAALRLTPKTAKIPSEGSHRFTAIITDTSGKGVANVPVGFTVTGDGSIAGAIATTVDTDANGTAVVTINTQLGDTAAGSGSLTATAATPAGTQTNSVATSHYTISAQAKVVTTKLTLTSPGKRRIREVARLSRRLRKVSVHFYTVRHGKRTYVGTATTNAKGIAAFTLKHLRSHTTLKATARPVHLPKGYRAGTYAPTKSHKVT